MKPDMRNVTGEREGQGKKQSNYFTFFLIREFGF